MWACANGHRDTAILLYQWNHAAFSVRNKKLQTAVECASLASFNELADELRNLEMTRLGNGNTISINIMNNKNKGSFNQQHSVTDCSNDDSQLQLCRIDDNGTKENCQNIRLSAATGTHSSFVL